MRKTLLLEGITGLTKPEGLVKKGNVAPGGTSAGVGNVPPSAAHSE